MNDAVASLVGWLLFSENIFGIGPTFLDTERCTIEQPFRNREFNQTMKASMTGTSSAPVRRLGFG